MGACSCLFRNPLPWLAALSSLLAFAHSSDFSSLGVLLTSSAIVLYPLIIFWTRKSCQQKSTLKEDALSSTRDGSAQGDKKDSFLHQDSCQNVADDTENEQDMKGAQENEQNMKGAQMSDSLRGSQVLPSPSEAVSDCERFDDASWGKDSEHDWICGENLSGMTQFSDGSISDEESLIEITLPEGHYVESESSKRQQQPWSYGFHQQKWSDCSLESHFRQLNWMDMLMEEENLIEIDIGMGSIKYSRFQIEA